MINHGKSKTAEIETVEIEECLYWPACPNDPKRETLCPKKPLNAELGIYTGIPAKL
jgi:hypothetical protein